MSFNAAKVMYLLRFKQKKTSIFINMFSILGFTLIKYLKT